MNHDHHDDEIAYPSPDDPVARREFLRLMGASLALAGMTACTRQPPEKIVPYVRQPEEIVPGRPLFFATSMALGGVATGLLVESHEGRPTKIEGNPLHPGSMGAADVFAQAAVLGLYDPDRAQTLTRLGDIQPWSAFLGAIRDVLVAQQPLGGGGLRILTESVNSPTLAAQIRDLLVRYPSAKWHQWDPASHDNARAGSKLAFGQYVDTQYRFDRADVVLAFDADFLSCGPASLRHARDYATRRRPDDPARMNRLYAIESMPTSTGSRADHRFVLKPSAIPAAALAIAARVGVRGLPVGAAPGLDPKALDAIARDLVAHRGSAIVIAGEHQPAIVHALAHAMNAQLGSAGRTVVYTDCVEAEPVDQLASIRGLAADMNAGNVSALIILGGNPVYTAPVDVKFAEALNKVAFRAHLSLDQNETSDLCHWQIPEAHFLESWSDARGFDGTASIVQPLIAPLYGGKSAHDVLAAMSDKPERTAHDLVRDYWKITADKEPTWRRWLHDGLVPGSAFAPKTVAVNAAALQSAVVNLQSIGNQQSAAGNSGVELSFRFDPCVLDGRFANNGWLQELPKPMTKLTWDNAVLVSPATAQKMRLSGEPSFQGGEHGQIASPVVEVQYGGRSVRGALFEVFGHPDDCVTLHMGYGRTRAGRLGSGVGFNASLLRTSDALWSAAGAAVKAVGDTYPLACTQYHHSMEGRELVRAVTLDAITRNPRVIRDRDEAPPKTITLYPDFKYEGYKWGMAIDVSACIGCNACVVACQAENNIPVVGKGEVLKGREMHWIRIDTYYEGAAAAPETYFQPVPCQQCENAPCEVVCPVGATNHSDEGLNDMVYNRCVGTRYCSNNCPYKVRRFNFLLYQDWNTPSLKLGRNPDVTVRSRGVMEKCTYCVQRINKAKIESEEADRRIRDGEIQPACAQTCPADAIVFGDLNDPGSRVAKLQAEMRNYALLGELNTRPRTTYLAAVRNVNPELEG